MEQELNIIADEQIVDAKRFSSLGNIQYFPGRQITNSDLSSADVLLVRSVTKVNQELLQGTPIKFIGTATSGIDHIDTKYLAQSNIHFAAAYGNNARSVVEYVFSVLYALMEKYGFNIQDKTIGIVGKGNVGGLLATTLEQLDIKTLCNDPLLQEQGVQGLVNLDTICAEADIISLHVPLTDDGEYPTKYLFNQERLASLKQDVILINSARGGVIEESALEEFKVQNPNAKLVLDVWENEPDINIETVLKAEIATSHIAGYSYDSKLKATTALSSALNEYLSIQSQADDSLSPNVATKKLALTSDNPIAEAIFSGYDVRIDHTSLMPILREPPLSRTNYFDMLRRTYPKRREFQTIKITSQHAPEITATLHSLGFQI